MNNIKKVFLGLVLFLITFSVSQACRFTPREYSQIYTDSNRVFIGKIIGQKKLENGTFSFEVIKNLKGKALADVVDVTDPMLGTSCQK